MCKFPRQKPATIARSYFWELCCSTCTVSAQGPAIRVRMQTDLVSPAWKLSMETQIQVSSLSIASLTSKWENSLKSWSHTHRKPIYVCNCTEAYSVCVYWGGGERGRKQNWMKSSSAQITSLMEIFPYPCYQLSPVTHRLWGNM